MIHVGTDPTTLYARTFCEFSPAAKCNDPPPSYISRMTIIRFGSSNGGGFFFSFFLITTADETPISAQGL